MWKALQTDFKEFVSTVTDDTTNALTAIDSRLEEQETNNRENPVKEEEESEIDDEGNVRGTDFASTGIVATPADEAARLITHAETFSEPLDENLPEVREFLRTFVIEEKTDEISNLLKQHKILKDQFESLVPTDVSYVSFWQRFFYKCDAERIQREWEERDEKAFQARAEAISDSINSVRNFLGGAVKAVSQTLADDNEENNILFGGRPPFVLNTAVDTEDEEEEEEELGWDDDDDVDDNNNNDPKDGSSEQIEFKNQVEEKLQADLKQALEERDQLQNTVEMQTKEITTLHAQAEEGKKTKVALVERETELAALKSTMDESTKEEREEAAKKIAATAAAQQEEIEGLKTQVQTKDKELEDVKYKKAKADERVSSLEETLEKLKAENEALKKEVAAGPSSKDFAAAKDKASALSKDLKEAKAQVDKLKGSLEEKDKQIAALSAQSASPDSSTSAVKVAAPPVSPVAPATPEPAAPVAAKISTADDEEEDDWGDDWGDDDDA